MSVMAAEMDGPFLRGIRVIWVTLSGRETRYVGRLYAERVFLFIVLTLAVVLSLDAARNLNRLLAEPSDPAAPAGFAALTTYLVLRAGYNIPAILPIAAWVGVIWTEFSLAVSRQRLMIANSGQPPLRSLAPALVVGLCLGLIQFGALAYLRPAAVEGQAYGGYRYYGPKFNAPSATGDKWISVEGAVIRGKVVFSDPPSLKDAVIYDLDVEGGLRSIRTATRAVPLEADIWSLENASVWEVPTFFGPSAADSRSWHVEYFDSEIITLSLNPLWVEDIDIQPPLLPQSDLVQLASAERGIQNPSTYRAALQDRYAATLYLLGMALLPAALGISGFLPGMGPGPSIGAVLWGIGSYFAASVMSQLGAYGYLPALISAWAVPVLVVGAAVGVVLMRARLHPR